MKPEILLAGSLGALFVFVLGMAKELWLRHREQKGLLRLIYIELKGNRERLRRLSEAPSDAPQWIDLERSKPRRGA